MPSKRSSVFNRSPERDHDDSDSSTDESTPEDRIVTPNREYNLPRDHLIQAREQLKLPSTRDRDYNNTPGNGDCENGGSEARNIPDRRPQNLHAQPPILSDTSSAGSPPAIGRRSNNNSYDLATDIPDFSAMTQQISR
jgi:hypothetical protein